MYVLAVNGSIHRYPYSIAELKRTNAGTSFPAVPSNATLAEWNVYPVTDKPAPAYNPVTQNCVQINPTLQNGVWEMAWQVTSASATEIAERVQRKEAEVRQQRNELLSACDWTQLPDSPADHEAWATYRQELRDVTEQAGFPWEVQWPETP
jgi:hypothetical protein